MFSKILDKLGDGNPQLLREIKGKLKPRNLLISGGISLMGQFLVFLSFQAQIPVPNLNNLQRNFQHKLCTGTGIKEISAPPSPPGVYAPPPEKLYNLCTLNAAGDGFEINWHLWWQEMFIVLSLISIFGLIVAGVYMLINDLAQEEKRGTLNFIRLSPQSGKNILVGKILGVPILLYFVTLLAFPLHLYAGFAANINPAIIFGFDGVLILSCIFFYTAALLFGLFGQGFKGFQPWIGSGLVLFFLWLATAKPILENSADWINLFSPGILLAYLPKYTHKYYYLNDIYWEYFKVEKLRFFGQLLGENYISTLTLITVNLLVGISCLWTSLNSRFVNPNKPILTKAQSYILVASWQMLLLGFSLYDYNYNYGYQYRMRENFQIIIVSNLILFLGLIAALSPQRQTLLDWARYGQEKKKDLWDMSDIKDLLFHEKSPAILTIAVNLGIMAVILGLWTFTWGNKNHASEALASLIVTISIILVYAIIAQTILFARSPRSSQLALGAIAGLILIPIPLFLALQIDPYKHPLWWMFTAFPWVGVEKATAMSVFIASVSQLSIFTVLTARFNHVLKKAGESEMKSLLSGSKV